MINNGKNYIRSVIIRKLRLAIVIGLLTGPMAVSGADQPENFCQSAGEKNAFDCAKTPEFQANQSDIDSRFNALNNWLDDEEQALTTPLVTTESPDSDKLRAIIKFNSQLLASELKQAKTIQQKGDLRGAFDKVNSYLASNPKDPNGWLLYGISLINQNKLDEAADVFSRLIQLYPESPEPYNNLAVVHARKGANDKAVEVLLQAFETHPSYAQVQKNLKAVYATLATQAYNRALNLDSTTQPHRATLGILDQVYNPIPAQTAIASSIQLSTASKPVAATDTATAIPEKQPSELVIEERHVSEGLVPTVEVEQPIPEVATTEATPAAETSNQPFLSDDVRLELQQLIVSWATAWSAQNVEAYLDFYTAEYSPDPTVTHKQWIWDLKRRISKSDFIKVEVSNISLAEAGNDKIRSVFRQVYQSDTYQDKVYKTLIMAKENGQWKIISEASL